MRVGVAGLGLIGGSIALRAAARATEIVGYDRDPAHLAIARERGMVARGAHSFAALAGEDLEILVLAGPLAATLEQLAYLVAHPPSARAILDTASVKGIVARAGQGLESFVPSHPIAGSERHGPRAARADLFVDHTWTLDTAAPEPALRVARDFVASLGARPLEIASDEHDRVIALTSHLPQIVSVALGAQLAARLDNPTVGELCGTGIGSMLRLGASSWDLWRAVLGANSVSVAQEVRRLAAILTDAAESLEADRIDALALCFSASASAVARLGEGAPDRKAEI